MLLHLEQLGLMDYASALELQKERVAQRKAGAIPDTLLLLEHPHVYTLGRNARRENMLVSPNTSPPAARRFSRPTEAAT